MIFREAAVADIPQIQIVRHAVRENRLSDPSLVTDADCEEFLTRRGKGWVCEIENNIVAFAIADLQDENIWALFVQEGFEEKGIGRKLQQLMLDWYFAQGKEKAWLSTDPGTRARRFYEKSGWTPKGMMKNNELRFEMTAEEWKAKR